MSQLVTRLNQMQTRKNYKFLHLDPNLVISSRTLTAIPDIFDRLIVAEALQLGLPLITSDSVIRASGLVNVIWN
jgi:PIN domain nuclease of toxin-antitoxin system